MTVLYTLYYCILLNYLVTSLLSFTLYVPVVLFAYSYISMTQLFCRDYYLYVFSYFLLPGTVFVLGLNP